MASHTISEVATEKVILAEIFRGEKSSMSKMKKNEKKIEMNVEKCLSDGGKVSNSILLRVTYSDTEEQKPQPHTKTHNGGLVRQPVQDGAGQSRFEWVFAGNVRKESQPRVWSDTHDLTTGLSPVLGTNNRQNEAKLRKHKKELGYTEVKGHGGKRRGAGRPTN